MKPTTPPACHQLATQWLQRFEAYIQKKDMGGARCLFHERTICFGLETDYCPDVQSMRDREWRENWPFHRGFTFGVDGARCIPEGAMIAVMVPWKCESAIVGAPTKRGRATIVLLAFKGYKLLCVHMHLSPNVKVAIG